MVLITDIETAFSVYQRIPEFPDRIGLEEMKTRVGEHYLSLVYEHNKQAVGFKLGYALAKDEFSSWLPVDRLLNSLAYLSPAGGAMSGR